MIKIPHAAPSVKEVCPVASSDTSRHAPVCWVQRLPPRRAWRPSPPRPRAAPRLDPHGSWAPTGGRPRRALGNPPRPADAQARPWVQHMQKMRDRACSLRSQKAGHRAAGDRPGGWQRGESFERPRARSGASSAPPFCIANPSSVEGCAGTSNGIFPSAYRKNSDLAVAPARDCPAWCAAALNGTAAALLITMSTTLSSAVLRKGRSRTMRLRLKMLMVASGLIAVGCNGVQLNKAVADGDGGSTCSVLPSLTCQSVEMGPASCTGQTGAAGNAALLPADAGFPPGCQAYFRSVDCSSRGYCTCDGPDDAGNAAQWNCHDADGGS